MLRKKTFTLLKKAEVKIKYNNIDKLLTEKAYQFLQKKYSSEEVEEKLMHFADKNGWLIDPPTRKAAVMLAIRKARRKPAA